MDMLGPIALPRPLFHYSNRAPPMPDPATCMEQVHMICSPRLNFPTVC